MNDARFQTYSNDRLDDISRRVFYTAMMKADALLASGADLAVLAPLAAIADAAACGFKDEDDGEI